MNVQRISLFYHCGVLNCQYVFCFFINYKGLLFTQYFIISEFSQSNYLAFRILTLKLSFSFYFLNVCIKKFCFKKFQIA